MGKLIISVLTIGILAAAMAEVEEPADMVRAKASYQAQVTFAKQAYLQKLESIKKLSSLTKSQVDSIQAEIDKLKGQSAETPATSLPDAAPDNPGANTVDIKAGKLTESPKDLTASDWDRLPGKVIKVDAATESFSSKDIYIKDGECFYAVPHPTEKWNLNKKVSCTWEGLLINYQNGRMPVGKLIINATRSENKQQTTWHPMDVKNRIEGPLRINFSTGYPIDEYPKIYYNGEIRVKLVPAE